MKKTTPLRTSSVELPEMSKQEEESIKSLRKSFSMGQPVELEMLDSTAEERNSPASNTQKSPATGKQSQTHTPQSSSPNRNSPSNQNGSPNRNSASNQNRLSAALFGKKGLLSVSAAKGAPSGNRSESPNTSPNPIYSFMPRITELPEVEAENLPHPPALTEDKNSPSPRPRKTISFMQVVNMLAKSQTGVMPSANSNAEIYSYFPNTKNSSLSTPSGLAPPENSGYRAIPKFDEIAHSMNRQPTDLTTSTDTAPNGTGTGNRTGQRTAGPPPLPSHSMVMLQEKLQPQSTQRPLSFITPHCSEVVPLIPHAPDIGAPHKGPVPHNSEIPFPVDDEYDMPVFYEKEPTVNPEKKTATKSLKANVAYQSEYDSMPVFTEPSQLEEELVKIRRLTISKQSSQNNSTRPSHTNSAIPSNTNSAIPSNANSAIPSNTNSAIPSNANSTAGSANNSNQPLNYPIANKGNESHIKQPSQNTSQYNSTRTNPAGPSNTNSTTGSANNSNQPLNYPIANKGNESHTKQPELESEAQVNPIDKLRRRNTKLGAGNNKKATLDEFERFKSSQSGSFMLRHAQGPDIDQLQKSLLELQKKLQEERALRGSQPPSLANSTHGSPATDSKKISRPKSKLIAENQRNQNIFDSESESSMIFGQLPQSGAATYLNKSKDTYFDALPPEEEHVNLLFQETDASDSDDHPAVFLVDSDTEWETESELNASKLQSSSPHNSPRAKSSTLDSRMNGLIERLKVSNRSLVDPKNPAKRPPPAPKSGQEEDPEKSLSLFASYESLPPQAIPDDANVILNSLFGHTKSRPTSSTPPAAPRIELGLRRGSYFARKTNWEVISVSYEDKQWSKEIERVMVDELNLDPVLQSAIPNNDKRNSLIKDHLAAAWLKRVSSSKLAQMFGLTCDGKTLAALLVVAEPSFSLPNVILSLKDAPYFLIHASLSAYDAWVRSVRRREGGASSLLEMKHYLRVINSPFIRNPDYGYLLLNHLKDLRTLGLPNLPSVKYAILTEAYDPNEVRAYEDLGFNTRGMVILTQTPLTSFACMVLK